MLISSPQGARDLLGRTDEVADRGGARTMVEMRALMGGNLLNLPHQRWLPRRRALQPMFTKRQVPRYAGHMASGRTSGRRRLARRRLSGPGHRVPQADAAGTRALGARAGPRRACRRGGPCPAYCRWHGSADRAVAAGKPAAVAAHRRPARRPPGQRHAAPAGRRNPARGAR